MEQAEIDRVRRALRRRPKPPWQLLWRGRPLHLPAGGRSVGPWARRRLQLQADWQLLWAERLRRDFAPIYRFVTCRRGRHHDAQVMADDLIGSNWVMNIPRWRSARSAAERSTGPTAPRRCTAECPSRRLS
jgi:hypothetical protein